MTDSSAPEFEEVEVEVTDDEEEGEEEEEIEYEEVEVEEEEEEEEDEEEGDEDEEEEIEDVQGSEDEADIAAQQISSQVVQGDPQQAGLQPQGQPSQPTSESLQVDSQTAGEEGSGEGPCDSSQAASGSGTEAPVSATAMLSPPARPAQADSAQESLSPARVAQSIEALRNIEAKTSQVAAEFSKAAISYGSKLSSAFSSVSTTDTAAIKDATASVNKLMGGFSSWWSSLDAVASQDKADDETESKISAASKATAEMQKLFGLSPHENLVETFKCKLLQTYGCSHNDFTPAIQMAFQGTLYITDQHTCFTVEERGRKLPFKVSHKEVKAVERQRPSRKGAQSDILHLKIEGEQKWLLFKDFGNAGDLDSALALLEHLTSEE
uniref:GRAM domain-containing protein n=1 Tax=Tetraselmis sp. GSL018 TaxID=582737 RepID=A0A061QPF5_9CHLO